MNGFVAGAAVLAIPAVLVATAPTQTSVLVVDVTLADGPRIELTLPLTSLAFVLDAYDRDTGTFHTETLVRAARSAPRGPLLHLVDGETEVRVRSW